MNVVMKKKSSQVLSKGLVYQPKFSKIVKHSTVNLDKLGLTQISDHGSDEERKSPILKQKKMIKKPTIRK